jgi:uncharacterized iron-regulated membrane protein
VTRAFWVRIHRWIGLAIAGFLIVAGFTGALLAWYHELDAAISPHLLRASAPAAGVQPLDPLHLRERVQAARPDALVTYVDLAERDGAAAVFYLQARPGAVAPPPADEVFVDPYTGRILGERRWGDLSQGVVNLMPFVYRLHYELALGSFGAYLFGVVALLWTIDCFISAALTLPARRRRATTAGPGYWARWAPAWAVRWRGGPQKLNFDLHRAGGLWPWAMLFVLAWSSVAFNLGDEVYHPVMRSLFAMQVDVRDRIPTLAAPVAEPPMGWSAGLAAARRHAATVAAQEGFEIRREDSFGYDPDRGLFHYRVHGSRDVAERYGETRFTLDARDGRLLGAFVPTGKALGDTLTSWLLALHMAALWGWPMQLFVSVLGLAVASLSITGVVIWLQRRRARRVSTARRLQAAITAD